MATSGSGPGTRQDLLADARDAGADDFPNRMIDEFYRRGLLGEPKRQSLGRGHGQAPAIYSPKQRALFQEIVRNYAAKTKYRWLATIPVWAWLNYGETWVSLQQLRRALRTAVGSSQRRSVREAAAVANDLLLLLDVPPAHRSASKKLSEVLTNQVHKGRVEIEELKTAVADVFEANDAAVRIGHLGEQVSVRSIVIQLDAALRAAAELDTIADAELRTTGERYRDTLRAHLKDKADFAAEAEEQLRWLSRPSIPPATFSVSTVLKLLGYARQPREGLEV